MIVNRDRYFKKLKRWMGFLLSCIINWDKGAPSCEVQNKIKTKQNRTNWNQTKQNETKNQNKAKVDQKFCLIIGVLSFSVKWKCMLNIVNCVFRPTVRQYPITWGFFYRAYYIILKRSWSNFVSLYLLVTML